MPKHSINALLGFGRNLAASVTRNHELFLAKGADTGPRVTEIEQLAKQLLAADQDAKKYSILSRQRAADARRLKNELYNAASNLVEIGSGLAGKHTTIGQEIRKHRKVLRRRRSPRKKGGA